MGKRGPKSSAPGGVGTLSQGYVRIYDAASGRVRMEHHLVWEAHHGPIPAGMQIHHVNRDRADNRIENLELVDTVTHKRLHSGCELRDGAWFKPCPKCGELKEVNLHNFYFAGNTTWPAYGRCRPCHVRIVVAEKRERRAARKAGGNA